MEKQVNGEHRGGVNVKDGRCKMGDLYIIEVAMQRDAIQEALENADESEKRTRMRMSNVSGCRSL